MYCESAGENYRVTPNMRVVVYEIYESADSKEITTPSEKASGERIPTPSSRNTCAKTEKYTLRRYIE